jgi:hypothetical protein
MRLDRIQAFIGGFRGDDGVLPHLQEFDERLAHCGIVFDDQDYRRCFANHAGIIVLSPGQRYT